MSDLVESGGSKYTDKQRRDAVAQYCALGNISAVSKVLKIPRRTLSGWTQQSWWDEQVGEVQQQITEEIKSRAMRIASKAGEETLDRLENGDVTMVRNPDYDNTKRKSQRNPLYVPIRTPVKAKDLSVITGIHIDKAVQLTFPQTSKAGGSDQLLQLAEHFKRISRESQVQGGNIVQKKEFGTVSEQ